MDTAQLGPEYQQHYYDDHYARFAQTIHQQRAHALLSSFYDSFAERVLDIGVRHDPNRRSVRVYEAGCGEGHIAAALRRVTAERDIELEYIGSDLSRSGLDLAAETVSGEFLLGDVVEVTAKLPPGSVDVVIAKNLLHHIDDPTTFLRVAAHAAGDTGRVFVAEPRFPHPLVVAVNLLAPRRERHYFKGGQRRNVRAVSDAGLHVVYSEPFQWIPYEIAFATRLRVPRKLFSRVRKPTTLRKVADLDRRLAGRMPWWSEYYFWVLAADGIAGSGVSNV